MTREEAIDILRVINPPRESKRIFDEFMQARDTAIKALEQPERKPGKWKKMQSMFGIGLIPVCSECEYVPSNREEYKFCPNCGAMMEGVARNDS